MTYMPGYPCETCGRQSNGVTINLPNKPVAMFCSIQCARDFMRHGGDLTKDEAAASLAGGDLAGAYLESIGVFDLQKLSADQWAVFCGTIYRGACEALARQADDKIPF